MRKWTLKEALEKRNATKASKDECFHKRKVEESATMRTVKFHSKLSKGHCDYIKRSQDKIMRDVRLHVLQTFCLL